MGSYFEQGAERWSDDTRKLDENMIVTAHEESRMKIHVRFRTRVDIIRKRSAHALAGIVHCGQIAGSGTFCSKLSRGRFDDAARLHERIRKTRVVKGGTCPRKKIGIQHIPLVDVEHLGPNAATASQQALRLKHFRRLADDGTAYTVLIAEEGLFGQIFTRQNFSRKDALGQ